MRSAHDAADSEAHGFLEVIVAGVRPRLEVAPVVSLDGAEGHPVVADMPGVLVGLLEADLRVRAVVERDVLRVVGSSHSRTLSAVTP